MKKFKLLVCCEESQRVCTAFRERGWQAYSCDIEPCSGEILCESLCRAKEFGEQLLKLSIDKQKENKHGIL